jgi:hypothetical protein
MEALSERATYAAVLVTLVRQRCAETGSTRTSRTGLQMRVPVAERPSVRRGFDALIEHGVLGVSGEDIGLTAHGRAFLSYYRRLRGDMHGVEDLRDPDVLNHLLATIDADSRFDPDRDLEEASTLPGRLEEHREARRAGLPKIWIVLALIVTLIGVVLLALPTR